LIHASHRKVDRSFPQILIFFIDNRDVLFDIGLVEDFDSLNHTHRPLIKPMRDGSGKPKIIDDRALGPPKLKTRVAFLHRANAPLTSATMNLESLESGVYLIPGTVRIWLRATSGDSAVLSNVSRDTHSTIPWHCKRRCQQF
jgi:hypothetical protein